MRLHITILLVTVMLITACGGASTNTTPTVTLIPTALDIAATPSIAPQAATAAPMSAQPTLEPTAAPNAAAQPTPSIVSPQATVIPPTVSASSANYAGTYNGVLPAADTIGRVVTLILERNGSATLTTVFIGKDQPNVEIGTWSAEGNIIRGNFTQSNGAPAASSITWEAHDLQLIATEFDQAQYGQSGPSLTRVGSGKQVQAESGGASFAFDSQLATSAQGKTIPPTPVANEPALGGAAPQHIRFTFNDTPTQDFFDPRQPQVYVFPVQGLKPLDPMISQGVDELQQLVSTQPVSVTQPIFVFPLIPASQVIRSQVKYLDFQNGKGVRFVTYYAQDVSPITSDRIFYTFQGLTSDGKSYVSVFWTLGTPALPNDVNVTLAAKDYDAFAKQYDTYLANTITLLDSLPEGGFEPNLMLLDNLVRSIRAP